jgi:outer membrane receptor protein involved in Fe transport
MQKCPGAARRIAVLLSGLVAAGLPIPGFTQSLEELVVTARKQEENLQEVPISVTAFSAAQLQNMGVNNNEEVAFMTVNFNNMSQIGRRLDRPVIRGMAAPGTFGEPNASFFIDGAFVSGTISTMTMGPIERVEILRGPQSAQFGRATFSGAVNYVTRKPTNEFTGELTARMGSHESRTFSAWASGPIIEDTLLFFASGSYDHYGGEWNNNLLPGAATPSDGGPLDFVDPPQKGDTSNLGGTQTGQLEGKLLWNISDTAELSFKFGVIRSDDQHYPQLILETEELNCWVPGEDLMPDHPAYETSSGEFCGVMGNPSNRDIRLNLPDLRTGMTHDLALMPPFPTVAKDWISQGEDVGLRRDQYNRLLTYEQDIGKWNMTARLASNASNMDTAYDLDGTEARAMAGLFSFYQELKRKDKSFDLRFASPVDRPVRGSVGFYFYDFEQKNQQHGNVGLAQGSLGDPTISKTKNVALYGGIEFDINDKLSIATETRFARDTKRIDSPISCEFDTESPYYDPDTPLSHKAATNSVTPRITVRYFATDSIMYYGQIAVGNKPGNFNTTFYNDSVDGCGTQRAFHEDGLAYVEEEDSTNYEFGAKTSWMDNRLIANVSFYYIDWEKQTVFETRTVNRDFMSSPASIGVNAGESTVYGMEIETSFAFTDNFTGSFAYGLTDGEFDKYFSEDLKDVTGDGDASGNQIPNSSRHNIVVSLNYARPIGADFEWFARTDYTYESKKYTAPTNFIKLGTRRRWNARTGLESKNWKLSLYVNNILDEQTPYAILDFPRTMERNEGGMWPQGHAATPTPGRIVGGELIWRFGN